MHFIKSTIPILISLLSVTQSFRHQARWADDEDYYTGLAARSYDDYEDDFLDLYSRDAEPEAYDNYEDEILAARAAYTPGRSSVCKRGEVLTKRGCGLSTPVQEPSHCNDVFVDNGPNHVPRQSRIDCYRRIQCKGSKKSYVGLNPLLEKAECLHACTCP